MNVRDIVSLLRLKPLLSWSGSAILVSGALVYSHYGYISPLFLLAIFVVVILQGIIAHALNDLADYEVDKEAQIKETSRSEKLLVSGKATKDMFVALVVIVSGLYLGLLVILGTAVGSLAIVFGLIGYILAYAYSYYPRFGWRPFSEFSVVLPVLLSAVLGLYYVGSDGRLSSEVLKYGLGLAFLNMGTFTYSRIIDFDVDRIKGKITTAVWLYETLGSGGYTSILAFVYMAVGIMLMFFPSYISLMLFILAGFLAIQSLCAEVSGDIELSGKVRKYSMLFVFATTIVWVMRLWL